MRRFLTLARMFLLMNLRERESLFWFFLFPVLLLLLLGSAFTSSAEDSAQVAAWLMAGILVQNIMAAGLNGDATWLAGMRDRGVLTRLRATPLPATALVGAYVAVRLTLVLLQSAVIVGVAMAVFGVQPSVGAVAESLVVTLVGAVIFLGLGQALAAVAANANAANVLSNMLFFPLLFLSNLVIDVEAFPSWLAALARWSPASMLVDLLRPALTTEPAMEAAWFNLIGLLLYGSLALLVVARWFRWEPRR